ncbi:MAG: DUF2316 family protein [Lachnospiraceae bacterium]|nr:DUF2316 family protein [Lachnospiraceae bacterium]
MQENLRRSDLREEDVAETIQTTEKYVHDLPALKPRKSDELWILRNFLIHAVLEKGMKPMPFTVMKGDWHDYWFLDGDYIDRGSITS